MVLGYVFVVKTSVRHDYRRIATNRSFALIQSLFNKAESNENDEMLLVLCSKFEASSHVSCCKMTRKNGKKSNWRRTDR